MFRKKKSKVTINKIPIVLLILLYMSCLSACGKNRMDEEVETYHVYMLNRDETMITPFEYQSETTDTFRLLGELIEVMSHASKHVGYREVVKDFMITGYSINENVVTIKVDEHYKLLSPTTEVLTRAAIVRTLTQLDSIEFVHMKIDESELTDQMGMIIGAMSAEQFVDNAGNEINTYENVELTLYFASENGKYLIKAIRPVEYSSNIPLERLVMEKLIGGPTGAGLYPTINSNTKIENITVKDSICYVNLNEDFLNQQSNVTPEVTIYSIVNTLVELEQVNKVQILIDGNANVMFRDTYELGTLFERNLDILKVKDE